MSEFQDKMQGLFHGMLRWEQWDALRAILCAGAEDGWFVYFVGDAVPTARVYGDDFTRLVQEIDALLRREHEEEYLGIVYADNPAQPTLVKIFDPNNLGHSCGSSGHFIPPGWVISKALPEPLHDPAPTPMNRKRWWSSIAGWLS